MGTGWARASLPRCAFQVDELERKVKSQQDQLFLTRQELTNTSAELKMRAMQAEGGRTQACDRGAGHGSPGAGADGEPRPRGRTEEPRGGGGRGAPGDPRAFPWASRAPGTGEEEVPAEPGGLGAAALQRGASSVMSSGPSLPTVRLGPSRTSAWPGDPSPAFGCRAAVLPQPQAPDPGPQLHWGCGAGCRVLPAIRPVALGRAREATCGSPLEGTGSPRFACLPESGSHSGKARELARQPRPHPTPGQVEHMTRHLEESERAMQERVQRLEAVRLSLEEVSPRGLGAPATVSPPPVSTRSQRGLVRCVGALGRRPAGRPGSQAQQAAVLGAGAEPGEGGGAQ